MEETGNITVQGSELKVLDLFTQSGLTSSNGEAKKMIPSGSLFINEVKIDNPQMLLSSIKAINGVFLLRKGKKQYKIVRYKK